LVQSLPCIWQLHQPVESFQSDLRDEILNCNLTHDEYCLHRVATYEFLSYATLSLAQQKLSTYPMQINLETIVQHCDDDLIVADALSLRQIHAKQYLLILSLFFLLKPYMIYDCDRCDHH